MIAKKKKTPIASPLEAQEIIEIPPPKERKRARPPSGSTTRTRASKASKVTTDVPEDQGSEAVVQSASLMKMIHPKLREEKQKIEAEEMVESLAVNAFKLMQDCLITTEKVAALREEVRASENAKTKLSVEGEKLKKENEKLQAKLEELRINNIDLKAERSKAQAQKAEAECEIVRLKSVINDSATYYAWRARVETIEEYAKEGADNWNPDAEREEFEAHYKDGAPYEVEDTAQDGEVQSKEKAANAEGSAESPDKGENTPVPSEQLSKDTKE